MDKYTLLPVHLILLGCFKKQFTLIQITKAFIWEYNNQYTHHLTSMLVHNTCILTEFKTCTRTFNLIRV